MPQRQGQGQGRSDTVRVGVLLPSRETAMTGQHDGPGLLAFAGDAEAAGFDSVWAGDSPLARIRMDPMALLAAAAAATTHVSLGTAAYTPALRHPLLVAHIAASVDQLSGGRLILGLGAGFPVPESKREFETLGAPFAGRSGRLDETAALWRELWSASVPARGFAGQRHWDTDAHPDVLPAARPGGPPLWLAGGDTTGAIQRTAALYDGWLPFLPDSARYARAWDAIRERAQRSRDITPGLYATIHLNGDEGNARAALDTYLRAYYARPLTEMEVIQANFSGSAQHCLDWLGRYIDAGARHIVLRLGTTQPRAQLELAAGLLPSLRTIRADAQCRE